MNNMDSDDKQLYELIAYSSSVQISFRHREFFNNGHIKSIFTNSGLLNKFQELLLKIEDNVTPEYEDGTVLRNMLELIVLKWQSIFKLNSKGVRKFLNRYEHEYNISLPNEYDEWLQHCNYYQHLPCTADRSNLENYYKSKGLSYQNAQKKVSDVIKVTLLILEGFLNICYRSQGPKPSNLPPKYIFSYIGI